MLTVYLVWASRHTAHAYVLTPDGLRAYGPTAESVNAAGPRDAARAVGMSWQRLGPAYVFALRGSGYSYEQEIAERIKQALGLDAVAVASLSGGHPAPRPF